MVSTFTEESHYLHTVPMSRQEADEHGIIWYLFSAESEVYRNLQFDKHIMITFSDPKGYRFLVVNGRAEVLRDQNRIDKYWNKFIETYFEKGKEDPHIRVLKVIPEEAHYWDNKTNKMMTVIKLATSMITDNQMDMGKEGDLEL